MESYLLDSICVFNFFFQNDCFCTSSRIFMSLTVEIAQEFGDFERYSPLIVQLIDAIILNNVHAKRVV